MIGVDLGYRCGSYMSLKGIVPYASGVIKPGAFETEPELERVGRVALLYVNHICELKDKWVAIEEPIYSWGRKNPRGFAKNVALFTLVAFLLRGRGREVIIINNKSAKMVAGHGGKDKEGMIRAYKKAVGSEPSGPKYAQETKADAYWIARAGKKKLKEIKP